MSTLEIFLDIYIYIFFFRCDDPTNRLCYQNFITHCSEFLAHMYTRLQIFLGTGPTRSLIRRIQS